MDNTLLETIKINYGFIENIQYHQKRFDDSISQVFNIKNQIRLADFIHPPQNGVYRCRVLYNNKIENIQYIPYKPKFFKKFKVVSSNIQYPLKYENRKELEDLKAKYSDFDEIIIEKNGLLSDTTISNIAFFDGKDWLTPKEPLLKGTMRAKLIDDGVLKLADITKNDITKFKKFAIMNAMLGFCEIKDYIIEN